MVSIHISTPTTYRSRDLSTHQRSIGCSLAYQAVSMKLQAGSKQIGCRLNTSKAKLLWCSKWSSATSTSNYCISNSRRCYSSSIIILPRPKRPSRRRRQHEDMRSTNSFQVLVPFDSCVLFDVRFQTVRHNGWSSRWCLHAWTMGTPRWTCCLLPFFTICTSYTFQSILRSNGNNDL